MAEKTKMIEPGAAVAASQTDLELVERLTPAITQVVVAAVAAAMAAQGASAQPVPVVGRYPHADGRPKTVRLVANEEIIYDGEKIAAGAEFNCDAQNAENMTRVYEGTFAFGGLRPNDANDAGRHKRSLARKVMVEARAS